MKIHWPPRPLGLGPPLNLVTLSPQHRARLGQHALQSIGYAIAAAIVIAVIDQVFFNGLTATRTPALNVHPTPQARVAVAFVGGFVEEIVFRLVLATAVAAAVFTVLRRGLGERARHVSISQWAGTIAALIAVGFMHVGLVADPTANDARVLAVNGVSNLVYGWTWWRRGLEMSTLTHGALNSTLYLGFPLLH